MAWIEAHQQLKDHPKVLDLMNLMGWDLYMTVGRLFCFWWWCVDYAEDGDLSKHNDSRLAIAVGLNGDQGKKFVDSMVQAGWIDKEPYCRVHDWWEYIGKFLQIKYKQKPDKWKSIQNRCLNSSENLIHNTTYITLLKDQQKAADLSKKFVYSDGFKDKATMAKAIGINIYQLLGFYMKQSKLSEPLPEPVLERVLDSIIKYKPKDQFPYFLRVLTEESRQYFANNQIRQHEKVKKEPSKIGELLKTMAKSS